MEFNVSTLDNQEQAQELEKTILTSEPNADINIDLNAQKVTINSEASSETFEHLIVASGHKVS
ncbi:MAG: heavy metal transport/detoxification protein [Pleurocapsa sp.]